MRCPACTHPDTVVTDSRAHSCDRAIRRRRRCEACEHRFTTFEILGDDILAAGFDAMGRLDPRALERAREVAEAFAHLHHNDLRMLAELAKRLTVVEPVHA